MKELVETLAAWRADGAEIGRAVVVRTFGSAPRPEGAVLLATADGRIAGSVSGGCVEGAAFEEIQRARATGRSRVIRYGISDEQAWDVGLACGGVIDVLVEPSRARGCRGRGAGGGASRIRPAAGPWSRRFPPTRPGPKRGRIRRARASRRPRCWSRGRTDASTVRSAIRHSTPSSSGWPWNRWPAEPPERSSSAGRSLFIEAFPTPPRLIVVGAAQVAIPLVAIARTLGYETIVVDGRPAFATPERFPDVDRLVVGWPDEVAD